MASRRRPDAAGATEVAQVLSEVVADHRAVADPVARDLHRLLSHSLAAPSAGERRAARLGLLIDLLAKSDGEYVSSEDYEEARRQRAKAGEEWPDASTLSRAFGHYLSAVRAGTRYWLGDGTQRVPASYAHAKPQASYKPKEIVAALIEAQREICAQPGAKNGEKAGTASRWPTEWEYEEWVALRRALARRAGKRCRLAGPKQIRKAFGSYAEAVDQARRLTDGAR